MQKDVGTDAAQALASELNETYKTKTTNLLRLVKKQADEIERRGQIIMKMDESAQLQQENILKLLQQNKHLESLLETLQKEREKMVEEIDLLKSKPKTSSKRKKVAQDEAA